MLSGIGHLSQRWAPFIDRHGTEKIEVRFPAKTCQECAARAHCTTGAKGRILKLLPEASISGAGEPPTGTTYRRIPASICAPCWYRRDDFTRSASDQDATESLSWGAEDTSASCADCSWDQCASHRHASSCTSGRASRHALNVEPPPLLVSRRWLDGDVQMSELHFPTESFMRGAFRRS